MQRRDFLKYSVALGVASALPLWSRAVFAAERPTLPIPDLLTTEIIQARFLASGLKCRYYNPAIHTAAFALPQYLQDALASQPS